MELRAGAPEIGGVGQGARRARGGHQVIAASKGRVMPLAREVVLRRMTARQPCVGARDAFSGSEQSSSANQQMRAVSEMGNRID